jgi:hypothetical protein
LFLIYRYLLTEWAFVDTFVLCLALSVSICPALRLLITIVSHCSPSFSRQFPVFGCRSSSVALASRRLAHSPEAAADRSPSSHLTFTLTLHCAFVTHGSISHCAAVSGHSSDISATRAGIRSPTPTIAVRAHRELQHGLDTQEPIAMINFI